MKKSFNGHRSALSFALVLFLTLFSFSCQEQEVPPTTGDVVVEVRRSGLQNVSYYVYTESYLTSNKYVPPIREGRLTSGQRTQIINLNHGNYVLSLDAGTNWRVMLQVTAGQERTFYID